VISDAGKMISAEGAQIGGMMQKLVGDLHKSLEKGEEMMKGRAAGSPQGILQSFQKDVERLAFIGALQKAIAKAGKGGPFNLETAVNDLWVALDGVKKGQKAMTEDVKARQAQLAHQAEQAQQVLQTMNSMLKAMQDASTAVIRSLR
jgi:hypothetical protein